MTVFIAALVHGMFILGLTFSTAPVHNSTGQGLDVLLTSDELPEAARNDSAAYLAQRTQVGSGNTTAHVAQHNRAGTPGSSGSPDDDKPGPQQDASNGGTRADARVIATTARSPEVLFFSDADSDDAATAQAVQHAPVGTDEVVDDTGPVQLRGPERGKTLAPDSREYAYAAYLVNWTRRVERVGTLNFPTAARREGVTASPVIQMVIDARGRLRSTRVEHSSGYPDLDQAALDILKLASPFDPFPPDMAEKTRTLAFAYEFRFTGGRVDAGSVQTQPQ
jgi:protein TonB